MYAAAPLAVMYRETNGWRWPLAAWVYMTGLGYLGVNGIFNSDFDVVRSLVFIGSILYVISNLLADVLYAAADPRIRYS